MTNKPHIDGFSDHEFEDDKELRLALGLPVELPVEDGPPPRPADVEEIRALHRGELEDALAEEVRGLTTRYREWHDAERHVLMDELDDATWSDDGSAQ